MRWGIVIAALVAFEIAVGVWQAGAIRSVFGADKKVEVLFVRE